MQLDKSLGPRHVALPGYLVRDPIRLSQLGAELIIVTGNVMTVRKPCEMSDTLLLNRLQPSNALRTELSLALIVLCT